MRQMRQWWFVGDADWLLDEVVGSGQRRNETKIVLSQELEKWEKKAVLVSV